MSSQAQTSLPQNKQAQLQSYQVQLKDSIRSMFDNFTEIIKLARFDFTRGKFFSYHWFEEAIKLVNRDVPPEEDGQLFHSTQIDQDHYEMQVRGANIVKAGESLMRLVSDLKQFFVLNDFPSVNESILFNSNSYKKTQNGIDQRLIMLRDEMASDLYELEEEYYFSVYK